MGLILYGNERYEVYEQYMNDYNNNLHILRRYKHTYQFQPEVLHSVFANHLYK